MEYLILDNTASSLDCVFRTVCKCKNSGCNVYDCGRDTCLMNSENICPKHCYAQVCIGTKIDPFSVTS